ncbi:hypothetical protein KC367_g31 [Hortaea werneckii]|nr:hypothetical protein KC367_g31 [Hortaea werneckii]
MAAAHGVLQAASLLVQISRRTRISLPVSACRSWRYCRNLICLTGRRLLKQLVHSMQRRSGSSNHKRFTSPLRGDVLALLATSMHDARGSGSAFPKNDNCRLTTVVRILLFVIAHSSFHDDYPKSFGIRWPISALLIKLFGQRDK